MALKQAFPGTRRLASKGGGQAPLDRYEGMTLLDYFAIHATDSDVIAKIDPPKIATRASARYAFAMDMLKAKEKAELELTKGGK